MTKTKVEPCSSVCTSLGSLISETVLLGAPAWKAQTLQIIIKLINHLQSVLQICQSVSYLILLLYTYTPPVRGTVTTFPVIFPLSVQKDPFNMWVKYPPPACQFSRFFVTLDMISECSVSSLTVGCPPVSLMCPLPTPLALAMLPLLSAHDKHSLTSRSFGLLVPVPGTLGSPLFL